MKIKFKKLHAAAVIPAYATSGSAGMDLVAVHDCRLWQNDFGPVDTGLAIELPPGFEAQVRSRSGLARNHGIAVLNSPGTIDSDYRGEIKVLLYNHGPHTYDIRAGDRIAQLVIAPVVQPDIEFVQDLSQTERGGNGFGSTG